MLAYVVRRLLIAGVTLVLVSLVVYGLIRAMPGDPTVYLNAGGEPADPTLTEAMIADMRRDFGLDRHWTAAYFEWLSQMITGDLGLSFRRRAPVSELIAGALGPTLLLSGTSLLLAYALSVVLGLYAAHRSGKPDERFLAVVLYILYSVPSYVVAILLVIFFGVELDLLPVFGMRGEDYATLSPAGKAWDLLRHMALPVVCSTYVSLAYYTRFIRSSISEVMRQDFIRTARAKGLSEPVILVRHAFRNALIPFVTLIGLSLPAVLSGSVILESIFAWPGMGRLFVEAVLFRDYPLIMGLTMLFSVLIVLGTLLADLLYAAVDPRISYS